MVNKILYLKNNSNIKEGTFDPSVMKPQVITLSTHGVDDNSILSRHLESSISVTPDKDVLSFFSIASTGKKRTYQVEKGFEKYSAYSKNTETEISHSLTETEIK